MCYDDTILLKLRRDFSGDEAFAFLDQKLKSSEIEKGILKSDIAELRDTIANLKRELSETQKQNNRSKSELNSILNKEVGDEAKKQMLSEQRYQNLLDELKSLRQKVSKLKIEKDRWQRKAFNSVIPTTLAEQNEPTGSQ